MSNNFKVAVFLIVAITWLAHTIWLQNKLLDLEAKFNVSREIDRKSMNFTQDWIRSIKRTMPESTLSEIQQLQLQINELNKRLELLKK
jgi:predicted small secreted protein